MTTGAVVFAFDTNGTDYVSMAAWCAARIHKWLHIPVTLITDRAVHHSVFDGVIQCEPGSADNLRWSDHLQCRVPWYNSTRCLAYELSPYDRTLLLDADYVVNSTALQDLLQHGTDIMCHDRCHDLAHGTAMRAYTGQHHITMLWATVVIFGRSRVAQLMFDAWRMVRDHWQHYRDIYRINESLFRNDHALTVAMNIITGHTLLADTIPWSMASVLPSTKILATDDPDAFRLEYLDDRGRERWHVTQGQDFHAMSKHHLGDIIARSA